MRGPPRRIRNRTSHASSRLFSRMAPHGPRCLHDPRQLAPLIILRQRYGLAEPALRTERKLLKPEISRSCLDPPSQLVDRLDFGQLRRDETEDHDLVLGHKPQGREASRTLAVVFEQQAIVAKAIEQALRNSVIV